MRLLGVTLVVAVAVGCGGNGDSPAAPSATSLTVVYWPQGREAGGATRWSLRCGPVAGTHPRARAACARLSRLERPFRPVPADAICTQVYGGPDEALVTGVHRGRRVFARFGLQDGCQISRWNGHVPVIPAAGSA